MTLDEMTMTDLAAMFAMMGLIARGESGPYTAISAYTYAEHFIKEKQRRDEIEQENEDDNN